MARAKKSIDRKSNILDKLAEADKKSKVYSTKRIQDMLNELKHGGSPDMTPFFHGNQLYRDAGVIFEYTDEELQELEKCADDPIHFIEKYCTFKVDAGRKTVKLRDYQRKVIHLFGDEQWDPQSESIVPKNRRITIMQSRLTGKCFSMNTNLEISDIKYKEIKLQNKSKYNLSKLWKLLRNRVNKHFVKSAVNH